MSIGSWDHEQVYFRLGQLGGALYTRRQAIPECRLGIAVEMEGRRQIFLDTLLAHELDVPVDVARLKLLLDNPSRNTANDVFWSMKEHMAKDGKPC